MSNENKEVKYLGQKLTELRAELDQLDIKKSGHNTYSDFKYFELDDILPAIKKLAVKYKICNEINFESDRATLTIINNENPSESFIFTSTIAEAKIKACNDIQNLGGTQTYLRRYLYMNAYEISESDAFDKSVGLKESKKKAIEIYNIGGQAGYKVSEIDAHIKKKFNCDIEKLIEDNSKQVIAGYMAMINKKNEA